MALGSARLGGRGVGPVWMGLKAKRVRLRVLPSWKISSSSGERSVMTLPDSSVTMASTWTRLTVTRMRSESGSGCCWGPAGRVMAAAQIRIAGMDCFHGDVPMLYFFSIPLA